jgi:FkbM family methyltransferase
MAISRWQKIKLGLVQAWPLHNKLRIAGKLLPMKNKSNQPLFDGISYLNQNALFLSNTGSYIDYSVFTTGSYEARISSLIQSQVQPGDTVLDIGANVGVHCVTMAKLVGKEGKVYAFEPIGFLRKRLAKNIWINRLENVTIIPKALSNAKSEENVRFDSTSMNLGTMSLANKGGSSTELVQVEVGDEVIESNGINAVHFIKIDVEGFEFHVLSGLANTIGRHRPRIIFEYDQNYIKRITEEQNVSESLFSFFHSKEYALFAIEDHGLTTIDRPEAFPASCNVFAIPQLPKE